MYLIRWENVEKLSFQIKFIKFITKIIKKSNMKMPGEGRMESLFDILLKNN